MRLLLPVLAVAALCVATGAFAQIADRTIDEIKTETLARAQTGAYPTLGIDPADARDALALIATRDGDAWAAGWIAIGDRYMAKAKAADPKEADANYLRAWRLYYFGQWPAPTSQGKQAAYAKATEAYLLRAKSFDPPLEVVRIPFDGSEIVGYLRLPAASIVRPVPFVLAISGLDSRKETVAETYAAALAHGIGFIAVDSPGTGQAPVKASETADKIYSRVLDYLATRPEIDKTRIVVHGQSFGAYWAAKLAHTEAARLAGAVVQSPPVHETFQNAFYRKRLATPEYLFDMLPASLHVYGLSSLDDLMAFAPKMSLKEQGLLGKPTAPMFVVGGARDTQVPIADLDLLMNSGSEPREAWINPAGGHMGRSGADWPDPVIFRKVVLPWEIRRLSEKR